MPGAFAAARLLPGAFAAARLVPGAVAAAWLFAGTSVAALQPGARDPARPGQPASEPSAAFATPWGRMQVTPGGQVDMRPFPPKVGRDRCINVNGVAGAQMFGDRALEMSMKNGQRYRLFFARECPALSFYQGFYYRRSKAGQLCAGRDVVGARSGGECQIASIIQVRRFKR